jgi:hypothetical protein
VTNGRTGFTKAYPSVVPSAESRSGP